MVKILKLNCVTQPKLYTVDKLSIATWLKSDYFGESTYAWVHCAMFLSVSNKEKEEKSEEVKYAKQELNRFERFHARMPILEGLA